MELFDKKTMDAYMKRTKAAQTALRSGLNRKVVSVKRITKSKLESDACYRQILPLQMTLPFNPFMPEDPTYDDTTLFQMEGSATTGAMMFKALYGNAVAQNDSSMLEVVEDRMGITPESFDFKTEGLTENETKLLRSWRRPVAWISPVVATQFSNRKVPYPTIRAVQCMFDSDGMPVDDESNDIALTLYHIESQVIVDEIDALNATFEPGCQNSHLSEQQRENMRKDLWKNRLISKPFLKYAVRFLEIGYNKQTGTPDEKCFERFEKDDLFALEKIKLCGRSLIDGMIDVIGTRKDYNFDYLEFMVVNPHIPKDKEKVKGTFAQQVDRHIAGSDDLLTACDGWEKFPEVYRQYRDNPEFFTDKIIKDSLYEFNLIDSESLVSLFTQDISKYTTGLADPRVHKMFEDAQLEAAAKLTVEITNTFDTADDKGIDFKELMARDKQDLKQLKEGDSEDIKEYGDALADMVGLVSDEIEADEKASKVGAAHAVPADGVAMGSGEADGGAQTSDGNGQGVDALLSGLQDLFNDDDEI